MVPSGSLLADPLSVTVAPEFTVCADPALATGSELTGRGGAGDEPPPPPPPPQAANNRVHDATIGRASERFRIPPYTDVHLPRGVRSCRIPAPAGFVWRELCAQSRWLARCDPG